MICLNYFSLPLFFYLKIFHFYFHLFELNFIFTIPSANFHRMKVLIFDQLQHFASFLRINPLILNHFQIKYLLDFDFGLCYYFKLIQTNFHFELCFFHHLADSKYNLDYFKYHFNFSKTWLDHNPFHHCLSYWNHPNLSWHHNQS